MSLAFEMKKVLPVKGGYFKSHDSQIAAVRSKAVFLLLLTFCLLLLPLWEYVIVLCFAVCYFMSILVLQSS